MGELLDKNTWVFGKTQGELTGGQERVAWAICEQVLPNTHVFIK
jgi:hypothetical protein